MNIALPAELEGRLSREEASFHFAVGLFAGDQVTLGQAATIAGISQPAFLRELGRRKISIHYGENELDEDIATVQRLMDVADKP